MPRVLPPPRSAAVMFIAATVYALSLVLALYLGLLVAFFAQR
jgi:hypothetical protein